MKRLAGMIMMICLTVTLLNAQTNGKLNVTVTTSSAGGNYAPKNVVAVWIEDNTGKFVKTLLAYANTRKVHLNNWETVTTAAGTAYNVTDAISGATQNTHATRTCIWNGTDYTGKQMPDADYRLRMELTDKNATGNISGFTFTKGATPQNLTPANVPSFSSIMINWSITTTAVLPEMNDHTAFSVFPNPGAGKFVVLGKNIDQLVVSDMTGRTILRSSSPEINLTSFPKGIYFVTISANQQTFTKKYIKK